MAVQTSLREGFVWEQGCPEAVGGEMSLGGCLGTAARLLWGFAVLEGVFVASVNIPLLLLGQVVPRSRMQGKKPILINLKSELVLSHCFRLLGALLL